MWSPPAKISDKEIVGRRAFGEDKHIFARADRSQYRIDVFLDTRLETDLSFDRVGIRKAEEAVLAFLTPLCREHGTTQGKCFRGWLQIPVRELGRLPILPKKSVGEMNPYHAELSRDDHRKLEAARSLAFRLCVLAGPHPFLNPVPAEPTDSNDAGANAARTQKEPATREDESESRLKNLLRRLRPHFFRN